jgi:branched-chain amino acid transport system permease protein
MNLIQQLINGIVLGHAYALIAIGWTVLLGVARLVNFGHGQIYMVGAFVTWWGMNRLGLSYFAAIPLAIVCGGAIGLVMQKIMLKTTFEQNLVSIMIMTLGFGHVLHGVAALGFGSTAQMLDTPLSNAEVDIGQFWISAQDITIVVVTVVFFIALKLIIDRTSVGRTVRMVAEDPKLAQLAAINVKTVYYGVFAFEGAAVAFAAALAGPRTPILTSMGFDEAIMTFVVVVLGGVGSIYGSYVAGVGLGIFTALFGALVAPEYSVAAAFVALIGVLVLFPGGLAAKR